MASLQTVLLAALILLAMALRATEAGPYGTNVEDSICCRNHIRYPVPPRLVQAYYWTSNSCRRPGVVLLTSKGRQICANPESHWVKKIMQRLDI